jgi:colanic acid/amylovoran biosynthesis glycosyltransferase
MVVKRMLMITTFYPYGRGEAFVAAELEYLSRCFGQIELVPICYEQGMTARPERHPTNLAYADKRWGVRRSLHVLGALLPALFRYRWAADLGFILAHGRKLDRIKELIRALYRASMFESFLASQVGKDAASFDIIYFYWLLPEIMGALRFREETGSAMHIVCRGHGGDLYEERRPGGYAGLRRYIVGAIDDVYCISEDGRRYLAERFPAHAAKFHVARLGVDDPGYLNRQPEGGTLEIVSCAFVVPGKRLHLIVDAVAYLLEADPALQVRWTHVGDGPLFDEVRAYARGRLGPRAQAVFKGYLTQAELRMLYRDEAFDVIVNVSDNEGIPVSLMEASSAGIPMVATDVGGNAEIVSAANGVLIPTNPDTATIAAALILFHDRGVARSYRQAARQFWEARFNAATNYEQFGRHLASKADATMREDPRQPHDARAALGLARADDPAVD